MVKICLSHLVETEEEASAWNSYSERVGAVLGQYAKGQCAVEFAGLGVIGRATPNQKKCAFRLHPGLMQGCGHPQMVATAKGQHVKAGRPEAVVPTAAEEPHLIAVLGRVVGYLRGAGGLSMDLPGVGTLEFSASSPRTSYGFSRSSDTEPVSALMEDSDEED
mmetsp:Transcript_16735/g.57123  ORF Transcript_16735/g.57123 Transcript_16735/m.57123 type:complete len:163 (-) Transcript_16735:379-867(-)